MTPEEQLQQDLINGGNAMEAAGLSGFSQAGSEVDPEDQAAVDVINQRNQTMYDQQLNSSYANYEAQQAQNDYALERNARIMAQPGVAEGNMAMVGMSWAPGLLPVKPATFNMPKPPEFIQAKARYKSMSMQKAKDDKDKAAGTKDVKRDLLKLKTNDDKKPYVNINEPIFKTTEKYELSQVMGNKNLLNDNIAFVTDIKDGLKFKTKQITVHGAAPNSVRKTTPATMLGPTIDLIRDAALGAKTADGRPNPLVNIDPNTGAITIKPMSTQLIKGATDREQELFYLYHKIFNKDKGNLIEINEGKTKDGKRYYNVGLGSKFAQEGLVDGMKTASIVRANLKTNQPTIPGGIASTSVEYQYHENINELETLLQEIARFAVGNDPADLSNIINRSNAGDDSQLVDQSDRKSAYYRALAFSMLDHFMPQDLYAFNNYVMHAVGQNGNKVDKNKTIGVIDNEQMGLLNDAGILQDTFNILAPQSSNAGLSGQNKFKNTTPAEYGYSQAAPTRFKPNVQFLRAIKDNYDPAPSANGKKQVPSSIQRLHDTYFNSVYLNNPAYGDVKFKVDNIQASGNTTLFQGTGSNEDIYIETE